MEGFKVTTKLRPFCSRLVAYKGRGIDCRSGSATPAAISRLHPICSPTRRLSSGTSADGHLGNDNKELPILQLPESFLRKSDAKNFDQDTMQRLDVSFDKHNGKVTTPSPQVQLEPSIADCSLIGDVYRIVWNDGLVSEYSTSWTEKQLRWWKGVDDGRIPWHNMPEEELRSTKSLEFPEILTSEGQTKALDFLYKYGIVLVTSTPIEDDGAGVAAMASALSGGTNKANQTTLLNHYKNGGREIYLPRGTDGPLRTLYGTVWSTTSAGQADGASISDSSYGHEALPLHTDMTYMRDPPGLQIFTMVQTALSGGESIFADGLAVASHLRATNPDAFDVLCSTWRRFRCIDQTTGWHLEAVAPIISVRNGLIGAIRHNDLDRLPDLPLPGSDTELFYSRIRDAHRLWDTILSSETFRLVVHLQPGDTVVVANQVSQRLSLPLPY